jgi:hypothetical protein
MAANNVWDIEETGFENIGAETSNALIVPTIIGATKGVLRRVTVMQTSGSSPTSYSLCIWSEDPGETTWATSNLEYLPSVLLLVTGIDSSDNFHYSEELTIPFVNRSVDSDGLVDTDNNTKLWIGIKAVGTTTTDDYTVRLGFTRK